MDSDCIDVYFDVTIVDDGISQDQSGSVSWRRLLGSPPSADPARE